MARPQAHQQDVPKGVTKKCKLIGISRRKDKSIDPASTCKSWLSCDHPWYVEMDGFQRRLPLTPYLKEFKLPPPKNRRALELVLEGGKAHPGFKTWVRNGRHEASVQAERKFSERPLKVFIAEYVDTTMRQLRDFQRTVALNYLATTDIAKLPMVEVRKADGQIVRLLDQLQEDRDWEETTWRKWFGSLSTFFNQVKLTPELRETGFYNPLSSQWAAQQAENHPKNLVRRVRIPVELERQMLFAANRFPMMRLRFGGALYMGLRRGEMLDVRCPEVDLAAHRILLPFSTTKAGKTTHEDQWVSIGNATVWRLLEERVAQLESNDDRHQFVFGHADGSRCLEFDAEWQAVFTAAGVESTTIGWVKEKDEKTGKWLYIRPTGLRWHDLRHEFAYRSFELTRDTKQVQLALRVSSEKMVDRYRTVADAYVYDAFKLTGAIDEAVAV